LCAATLLQRSNEDMRKILGAFEMTKDVNPIEQWNKMGATTLEAWKKLAEINSGLAEKISKQQKAVLDQCLEASNKQLALTTESKDYRELFSAQSELVSEQSQKFVELAREVAQVLEQARTELTGWMEDSTKQAWAPVTSAAKTSKVA
jgi:phasin family protein